MRELLQVLLPFVPALLLALAVPASAQDAAGSAASISGFVRDATSGETLLLANVVPAGTSVGAATNNAGYYTLTGLEPGTYTVVATYIGYRSYQEEVTLAPGEALRLDIALVPAGIAIGEVVVTAEEELEEEAKNIGVARVETDLIKRLPAVLEPDLFRSLQLLPGVKAASDFSSGLYIRGGSPDQTLVLLDRNTVYNPSHFFGLFSPFNPDAIKDVRLYKGGYPATYGGRLGAVVDVYNKDGNRNEVAGGLSMGLLASRMYLEGPHGRGSWMLAARRSTLEPVLAVLRSRDVESIPNAFYFYDLNGKIGLDASPNDRFSLSFYAGRDDLDLDPFEEASLEVAYGNQTVSANWTHLFSEQLFSHFTLTASRYFSDPIFEFASTAFTRENGVTDVSAKGDLEWIPNRRHAIEGGFWGGRFTSRLLDTFNADTSFAQTVRSVYGALYLQETFRPSPLWTVVGGLRASYFGAGGYLRLEPRLSLEHQPRASVRLQASYGRYYQYLSLITSETLAGFDIWVASADQVAPQYGDQYGLGAKTALGPSVNVDAEVYYRTMQDLFRFDPSVQDPAGEPYERLFIFGEGYAWGAELLLERTSGRLSGFVGYTFGRTRRRYPSAALTDLTRYYSPKYDRTHDVNVVANLDLARTWRLTGVFSYATGQPYAPARAQTRYQDSPFSSTTVNVLGTDFGGGRLPDYHRLDVGIGKVGRFFGFADYEAQFQVINVYSRRNVWFYFNDFQDDNTIEREVIPQIPVPIPNLSLTLRF